MEVLQILTELSNNPANAVPLLKDPLCACMLIRLLPPAVRSVVVKYLMIQGAIPFTLFVESMGTVERTERNALLRLIKAIGILNGRAKEVWINAEFQNAVLSAPPLLLPNVHPFFHSYASGEPASSFHAHFERLLMSMVKGDISSEYSKLLQQADLLSSSLQVTSKGFQFLMAPRANQLWALLMLMVKPSEYQLILHLVLCRDNIRYTTSCLPSNLLAWLQKFGLVQVQGETFMITDLTYHLLPHSTEQQNDTESGFIILETNYSLYAYTSNPLHISLLSLFLRLSSRFPNLLYGRITFESIRNALESGITADQIITYLHIHAHPQARQRYGLECSIPPNLADQIRLWELERQRTYKNRPGVLWSGFLDEGEWQRVLQECDRIGAKLYANSAKRLLIVDPSANDYLKSLFANNNKRQPKV